MAVSEGSAQSAAQWLSRLPTDACLVYPFTAQFIRSPELAGTVDQQWLTENASRIGGYPFKPIHIGTPLVKSRFDDTTFPLIAMEIKLPVPGEVNRTVGMIGELQQRNLRLSQLVQQQAAQLQQSNIVSQKFEAESNQLKNSIKILENKLQESQRTAKSYYDIIQTMQYCIDNQNAPREEPPDKEAEIQKLKNSEMELSEKLITQQEKAEQATAGLLAEFAERMEDKEKRAKEDAMLIGELRKQVKEFEEKMMSNEKIIRELQDAQKEHVEKIAQLEELQKDSDRNTEQDSKIIGELKMKVKEFEEKMMSNEKSIKELQDAQKENLKKIAELQKLKKDAEKNTEQDSKIIEDLQNNQLELYDEIEKIEKKKKEDEKNFNEKIAELQKNNIELHEDIEKIEKKSKEDEKVFTEKIEKMEKKSAEDQEMFDEKIQELQNIQKILEDSKQKAENKLNELKEQVPSTPKRKRRVELASLSQLTLTPPSNEQEEVQMVGEVKKEEESPKYKMMVYEDSKDVNKVLKSDGLKATVNIVKNLNGFSLFDAIADQLKSDFGRETSPTNLLENLLRYLSTPEVQKIYENKIKAKDFSDFSKFLESVKNGDVSEMAVDALSRMLKKHIWVFTAHSVKKYTHFPSPLIPLKIALYTGAHQFYRSTENYNTFIDLE